MIFQMRKGQRKTGIYGTKQTDYAKKYGINQKKVEGKELTRDDFISVIFTFVKSSEKIYEDLVEIKSEAYVGMKSNVF